MWIVTKAVNEYNQEGEYFVSSFLNKPTFKQLSKLLPFCSDATIGKLTRGGGRENKEGVWFYLDEVKEGELFNHKNA